MSHYKDRRKTYVALKEAYNKAQNTTLLIMLEIGVQMWIVTCKHLTEES